MRSAPHGRGAPQLAVPARPAHRRLCSDPGAMARLRTEDRASLPFRTRLATACRPSGSRTKPPGSPGLTNAPIGPDKFAPIPWVYADIVRHLARVERVRILVRDAARSGARATILKLSDVESQGRRFLSRADESRLDSRFRADFREGCRRRCRDYELEIQRLGQIQQFKARRCRHVEIIAAAELHGVGTHASRSARGAEGGGIDVNGLGTLLTTEEWLLSKVQVRNPGFAAASTSTARNAAHHRGMPAQQGAGAQSGFRARRLERFSAIFRRTNVLWLGEESPATIPTATWTIWRASSNRDHRGYRRGGRSGRRQLRAASGESRATPRDEGSGRKRLCESKRCPCRAGVFRWTAIAGELREFLYCERDCAGPGLQRSE